MIVTVSGIGKVQAGMLTSIIFDHFDKIDLVINNGISGGVKENSFPGSVIIGLNYSYADVFVPLDEGNVFGQMSGLPRLYKGYKRAIDILKLENIENVIFGDILTGDKFFTDYDETSNIIKNYFSDLKVCAFDMETTAFAQGCYIYNANYLAIRSISDIIGVENQSDNYFDYAKQASEISNKVLLKLLELL